jgi:hypothetical protein
MITRTASTIAAQKMPVRTLASTSMDTDLPMAAFEPSWPMPANQDSVTTTLELRVLPLDTTVATISTGGRPLEEGETIVPKKLS